MATYKVTTPQGKTIQLEGPDGATDDEIIAQAQRLTTDKTGYGATSVSAGKKPNLLDNIGAGVRKTADSFVANYGDELSAAANAVLPLDRLAGKKVYSVYDGIPFKEAYKQNFERADNASKTLAAQYPKATGAGNFTGGVAQAIAGTRLLGAAAELPAVARVGAAVPARVARVAANPVVRNVGAGYAAGAVNAAGAADPGQRGRSAALGGFTGAALGGAATGVSALAPVVKRYMDALGGREITPQALTQIQRSLANDGYDVVTPGGRAALEAELSSYAGKPVSLADVGMNTRARAGVGLRTPSPAQNAGQRAVLQRAEGARGRLSQDIRANVAPRTDVHALDDALLEQIDETALPLREQALNGPDTAPRIPQRSLAPDERAVIQARGGSVAPIEDEVLQNLARLPAAQRALQGARALAGDERGRLQVQGLDTTSTPEFPTNGAPLNMRQLDYMKRFMDKEVDRLYAGTTSERAQAAELGQLRNAIRERMRAASPEYGQYLDAYGDIAEQRSALVAGRGGPAPNGRGSYPGMLAQDPERIAAEQAERSTAAQELFRVGGARKMDDLVSSTTDGRTPATRIMNDDVERRQLAAAGVPQQNVEALQGNVNQERTFDQLVAEIRGSQTDVRQAARQNADAGIQAQLPFNPASKAGWAGAAIDATVGALNLARNSRINEQVLPRLLETDPQTINTIVTELVANGRRAEAQTLARAARTRFGTKVLGNVIGAPVAFSEDTQ